MSERQVYVVAVMTAEGFDPDAYNDVVSVVVSVDDEQSAQCLDALSNLRGSRQPFARFVVAHYWDVGPIIKAHWFSTLYISANGTVINERLRHAIYRAVAKFRLYCEECDFQESYMVVQEREAANV